MKFRSAPVSRARPLLGTLVEIGAWGGARATAAVESAFDAVAQVQRLMCVHDPDSDVGRLNRGRSGRLVRVHAWTAEVLRFALELQQESGGVFDCGIGAPLEAAGFLPAGTVAGRPGDGRAGTEGMEIDRSDRVRLAGPVCIDLGGIAKGYAVDRAVEALLRAGVAAGLVNAGGDLRVFGVNAFPIQVRDPSSPRRFVRAFSLREGAVATSAGYYSSSIVDGLPVMPIFDPARRRFLQCDFSVTVVAASCMTADALTKVAAIQGADAVPLLRRHGAEALWWRRGRIRATWEAPCRNAA